MKIPVDPRLPTPGSVDFDRSLYSRLYALFGEIAGQVNGLSEGLIVASYSSDIAPPTSGKHYQGDQVRNRNPTVIGNYIILGWVCVASGEPGTWKEMRCQTV